MPSSNVKSSLDNSDARFILDARAAGWSWGPIADVLQISPTTIRKHVRRWGIEAETAPIQAVTDAPQRSMPLGDELPMPPGASASWGALTDGTVLAGMPYPAPVFRNPIRSANHGA